jgi:hypothetical protein
MRDKQPKGGKSAAEGEVQAYAEVTAGDTPAAQAL